MRYADIQVETPRLILRPFEMGDAEDWFNIMRSPEVTRYWSHLPWQSLQEAQQDIIQDITHMERKEYLRLAVIDKETNALMGMCVFFNHYPSFSTRGGWVLP
ncbi:GNAT family N-acetyltransferase [Proteus vulgaris]